MEKVNLLLLEKVGCRRFEILCRLEVHHLFKRIEIVCQSLLPTVAIKNQVKYLSTESNSSNYDDFKKEKENIGCLYINKQQLTNY